MNTCQNFKHTIRNALILFCVAAAPVQAAGTDIDNTPLGTLNTSTLPNLMVMLDDSGSMDWDYLPDNASNFKNHYGFNSAHCNGTYYNPNLTYTVPVDSAGNPLNGSIGSSTQTAFGKAYKDGYNPSSGTVNLDTQFTGGSGSGSPASGSYTGSAFYYTYTGTQTLGWQMNYYTTSGTFYTECQIGTVSGGTPAVPTATQPFTLTVLSTSSSNSTTATITVSGSSATTVSAITVLSSAGATVATINSGSATGSNTNSTEASRIAAIINALSNSGYTATAAGSVVTITGPASAAGDTLSITKSGSDTFTTTAFAAPAYTVDSNADHLQNFANWYSYYSHRMLMMKTGLGLAFADTRIFPNPPLTPQFRVGFMTMNNNVSPDFVNINDFIGGCTASSGNCQKDLFYTKLYGAVAANSTPLREALSHVGQLYAHKFGSITSYTATITVTQQSGCTASTPCPSAANSVQVNGVELLNCALISPTNPTNSCSLDDVSGITTSQIAQNIANEINAMVVTEYGASASGNVITITGIAGSAGFAPVVTFDDSADNSYTSTAFTGHTTTATLNGVTPTDPMQYSCQQNFVLLSTDGFWNGPTDYNLQNGLIGDPAADEPRPLNDGGSATTQTTSQITETSVSLYQQQTRTDTLQMSTSNLQQSTYPLQSSTSALQQSSYPLQSSYSTLQSSVYQLLSSTSSLQSSVYQLLSSTSSLQGSVYQLLSSTSSLQSTVYPLLSSTATLQGTVAKVLMSCPHRTATCGTAPATGIANTNWAPATSCTTSTNNQCAVVVPSPTLTQNVSNTCNTAATINASSPYTATNSDGGYVYGSCAYTAYTTPASVTSCTYENKSAASPYTQLTATTCSYGTTPTVTTVTSCATVAAQTSTANGAAYLPATSCAYTAYSAPANAASCTYQNQTASSPYAGPAVTCSYAATPTVSTVTSCSTSAKTTATTNGTAYNATPTSCAYTAYSTPANAASCTYQNQSATSPYAGPAVTCSYAATPTVSNVTSCSTSAKTTATTNGTAYNATPTSCAYTAYSTPGNVASCTYQNQSATSPYAGPAVTCSYGTAAVSTVNTCTISNKTTATTNNTVYNASAVTCAYATTPVVNNSATSCTYQNPSTGTTNGTVYTGPAVTCSYGAATASTVASCSTSAKTTATANGTAYNANAISCAYAAYGAPVNAAGTCTTAAQSTSSPYSGPAVTCSYSVGAWTNAASCTAVPESTASPYSVLTATECQKALSYCQANQTPGCTSVTSTTVGVPSCTATTSSTANPTISCATNTTTAPVTACTPESPSSANNFTTITCTAGAGGQPDSLANVAEYYYVTDLRDSSLNNCTGALGQDVCYDDVPTTQQDPAAWQHMTTFTLGLGARGSMDFSPYSPTNPLYIGSYTSLGSGCTLATDGDFCAVFNANAVGSMGTAIGAASAGETICNWQTNNQCTWPVPSSGSLNNIDDLWHAGVTGRGSYFSATDPASLSAGLASTFKQIQDRVGTSASATTSTPNLTTSNNFVFSSTYTSGAWFGDMTRQSIDVTNGSIISTNCSNSTTYDWEANGPDKTTENTCASVYQLDALAKLTTTTGTQGGNRTIYTIPIATGSSTPNTGTLEPFTYSNMTATEKTYFNTPYISGLTQWPTLTPTQQTSAAGANLVNYLRGDQSNLNYYFNRIHILGDIVDSKAAYVAQPVFSYGDTNYAAFVAANASRTGMVYVGANDGMLHAFYAGGPTVTAGDNSGAEAWAYVPALVKPNLYLLADSNYASKHYFFVDGTPVTGDVCPYAPGSTCYTSDWKTILVGGLNAGGAGYYALDITDPAHPASLWEFKDADMGDSFGSPAITKLADGTWVVILTSGYNNPSGKGNLYVLNAYTGKPVTAINGNGIISTGVGSPSNPSGLAQVAARVTNPSADDTVLEVYGGDLFGNLWRFDINNTLNSAYPYSAQLITTLKDAAGNAQPITTAPAVGTVSNQTVVFVGTGQLLGVSDLSNTQTQAMYGIMDPLKVTSASPSTAIYPTSPQQNTCNTTTLVNCFVKQTATDTACPSGSPTTICTGNLPVRTGSGNAVSFPSQYGWYINFPDSGERDNTNPILALGTLGFTTNTPTSGTACESGGYSYDWFLDFATGAPVSTSSTGVISIELGQNTSGGGFSSGFSPAATVFTLSNGTAMQLVYNPVTHQFTTIVLPVGTSSQSLRRTSWRELITQ